MVGSNFHCKLDCGALVHIFEYDFESAEVTTERELKHACDGCVILM